MKCPKSESEIPYENKEERKKKLEQYRVNLIELMEKELNEKKFNGKVKIFSLNSDIEKGIGITGKISFGHLEIMINELKIDKNKVVLSTGISSREGSFIAINLI